MVTVSGGAGNGHQALVHPQDLGLLPVHIGRKAVIVGHGEEHQIGPVQRGLSVEACAGHLKGSAGRGPAVGTILGVAGVGQVVELCRGQGREVLPVGHRILLSEHQCPHEQVGAGGSYGVLILGLGEVVIVGEAHGNVVLILVENIAVQGVVIRPALIGFGVELLLMRERGQQVSDAEQTAQSIVGEFGLTAHIPLDPQCRVET